MQIRRGTKTHISDLDARVNPVFCSLAEKITLDKFHE
jgi:hypothetical protein